jgi:hypothetical protein
MRVRASFTFSPGMSGRTSMMQTVHSAPIGETPTRLNRQVTAMHFLERAKHYRYAAALSDNPQNIQRFIDLAFMFERLANDFAQWEAQKTPKSLPSVAAERKASRREMHEIGHNSA